jgi:hypothetical protein
MASSFLRFLDHTQRRNTVGRTPLDERSARRRDLYLTTHSTHNRRTSMPPVGFEPTISAGKRPQTCALYLYYNIYIYNEVIIIYFKTKIYILCTVCWNKNHTQDARCIHKNKNIIHYSLKPRLATASENFSLPT